MEWIEFIQWDRDQRTKQDYYLAQIAAEVRRGYVEKPKAVKVGDFLMQQTHVDQQERARASKQAWADHLNTKLQEN